jgi:transcriptional regulator NrdR family protein
MICPTCNAWTRVLETRHKYDNQVYRRYECANTHRFSTMEKVVLRPVKQSLSQTEAGQVSFHPCTENAGTL